ncbi:hypothetical protein U9M48_043502, partial [Paspalum notatum var. saurae]
MCDIFAGDAGFCVDGGKAVPSSIEVVEELYGALERGDGDAVRQLLNPDVDWWFHGPRAHQHLVLMRLLTGAGGGIPFKIRSLDAFGSTVLAEGTDATGALYWVHAWTVGPCGRVTEVREYCNTALVVRRLGGGGGSGGGGNTEVSAAAATTKDVCSQSQQVWQSRLPELARRNLPGLLAVPRSTDSELANDDEDCGDAGQCPGDGEAAAVSSKAVVEALYGALERGDADAVRRLLNPDVDWWFHGPRAHQHLVLMRLLTGAGGGGLPFKIRTLDAFGTTVLAEGTDATGALYWVHAWTVGPGGRVTEVREYCNTALVVTRLGGGGGGGGADAAAAACSHSPSEQVWQSRLPDRARRNLPGL